MSGVQFDRKSAQRVADATKRVEALPRGTTLVRRESQPVFRPVFFILDEALGAASDSLTSDGATVAQVTVYTGDPTDPPVMAADQSTYTPQALVTSSPARTEWVVNRSMDLAASSGAAGIALPVNGELLVIWVDCTVGT